MARVLRAAALICLGLWLGCASKIKPGETGPVELHDVEVAQAGNPFPNWPVPPKTAMDLMANQDFEVRERSGAGGGTTGAEKYKLYFPDADVEFSVKWKTVPSNLDGINNAPRKELATYAIQPLFLDPEDYVVPTSAFHCIEIEQYRQHHALGSPTVAGTSCVLGLLSVWLKDVTIPAVLYDEARFHSDPVYAHFMANMNLLTFLADHRDGRDGNFLAAKNEERRQVFAVDNGISFGPLVFNYFVPNWTNLRVPALRKASIDRLRTVERGDLDFLLVISQLEPDAKGILRNVPPGPPIDPDKGARKHHGVVQFGLTRSEIDGLFDRIQKLVEAVDAGQVPVF